MEEMQFLEGRKQDVETNLMTVMMANQLEEVEIAKFPSPQNSKQTDFAFWLLVLIDKTNNFSDAYEV